MIGEMSIAQRAVVIGLTAPFGSGSTTSAQILSERMEFTHSRLSSFIRSDHKRDHPEADPSRFELQTHGDDMRQKLGPSVLVDMALESLRDEAKAHDRIIFDGIRNLAEVERLRDQFG